MSRQDALGMNDELGFNFDAAEAWEAAVDSIATNEARSRRGAVVKALRLAGVFAAAPLAMAFASYFSQSDTELADDLLKRGENPASYCAEKGGVLDVIQATGVTNEGTVFMHSTDTPWDRYGQQEKFRFVVNRLGLAADGEVQVCEVGELGDGERQVLSIAPNEGDVNRLEAILVNQG